MRIARIIEYFPPHLGGMERHGLILSQEQIKLGHKVDVFIGFGGDLKSEFKDALKSDFGVYKAPFQFLPLYSKMRHVWFNFWAVQQVKKCHRENPYDVIHLHGDFIEAYFGGKLSKKLNIPAILTIHAGLNKKLLKPKNAGCFGNIKKIICVSEEIAQSLKKIGVAHDKILVISSGIYLDEFKKGNGEIVTIRNQYSKPIIISTGVLRVNKGFGYLIGAFKEVLREFNSAILLIIGDGPEKDNLIAQASGIERIKFLGKRGHDEVVRYLKAADIFVLASVSTEGDREGTSTSIMEAMAAGLPIVATKVGGNPYLIRDYVNGILIDEKSINALADAIIKLIQDKELAAKIMRQNLEDVKQKDWPIVAKQITDIYLN